VLWLEREGPTKSRRREMKMTRRIWFLFAAGSGSADIVGMRGIGDMVELNVY
jgi:hypothetical protein